jgi:tRNA-2-methylthio-N6-dimethylallyladenosine synthase
MPITARVPTARRGRWAAARSPVAEIEGIERLRYTTSHPRDMDETLIAAHGENPKVMPYLHLPVQSGSDRVLNGDEPQAHRATYLDVIGRIRAAKPDIALSSDFIVGFPGETDEDFARTLELVETVGFAQAYSFKYSPRPGTPAADRADQVPEPVKAERLAALQGLLEAQQQRFNTACVGREFPLLLERAGRIRASSSAARPICRRSMLPPRNTAPESVISCRSASIVLADTASLPILWVGHE